MLAIRDNLAECFSALRAHKLRASLTMLGLTMGVATLITVMTIVQGANVYVEQKIANLGTNVFQIARTPFAVTDFNIVIKALKYRKIELDDMQAIADRCTACGEVGASASSTVRVRYGEQRSDRRESFGPNREHGGHRHPHRRTWALLYARRSRTPRQRLPDWRHAGAAVVSRGRSDGKDPARRTTTSSP